VKLSQIGAEWASHNAIKYKFYVICVAADLNVKNEQKYLYIIVLFQISK